MSKRRHDNQIAPTSLPRIGEGVIKRFQRTPRDFEAYYHELKRTNPEAALWLLGAAEDIAPADAAQKERYATLALELFHMLNEQALVNRLAAIYNDSFKVLTDAPTTSKLSRKKINEVEPDHLTN